MHLKQLTLKGFKSFAEPVTIGLRPGVTVVVGPNGSGKSNVVDAVAWALGAQAPSSVRSGRMDDVIFAGTASKAALGRAEVSLTFDNSDDALGLGFSEVSVRRTLFRSGDSVYELNGAPCRLVDITDMLSDSGLGRGRHVIISQNHIDAVLVARPTERRGVIEEAAGVLQYRRRRESAERRLAGTDSDMVRLGDQRRSLQRQLRPLRAQAEAARRHSDLLGELEALRVYLAGVQIAELRALVRTCENEAASAAQAVIDLGEELRGVEESLGAAEAELSSHGEHDRVEDLARWEALRERARGVRAVITEKQRAVGHELGSQADLSLIASLESEQHHLQGELEQLEGESADIATQRRELQGDQEQLSADTELFAETTAAAPGESIEGADAGGGAVAAVAQARGELDALGKAIAADEDERRRLQDLVAEARARLTQSQEHTAACDHEVQQHNTALATARRAAQTADEAGHTSETALAEASAALSEAETRHTHWITRLEALEGALADSAPARSVPADTDGVVGWLADLVDVRSGAEAAFVAAVDDLVSAVVVQDLDHARAVLNLLAAGDSAGAVLAPQALGDGASGPVAVPDSLTPLRSLVSAADAAGSGRSVAMVNKLLDVLLGDVVIVDGDWREAVEVACGHPELVVVNNAGDHLSRRGWRLGIHNAAGLTAMRNEAAGSVTEAQQHLESARAAHEAAVAEHTEAGGDAEQCASQVAQATEALSVAEAALNRAEADQAGAETAVTNLQDRLEFIDSRLQRDKSQLSDIENRMPQMLAAEAAETEQRTRHRELRQQQAEARAELDRRTLGVEARRARLDGIEAVHAQRRRMLSNRLDEVSGALEGHRSQLEAASQRRESLRKQEQLLETLQAEVDRAVSVTTEHLEAIRRRRHMWSERVRELSAGVESLRGDRRRIEASLEESRQAASGADVRQAEARTQLHAAVERLREDHGITPAAALEAQCPPGDPHIEPAQRAARIASELQIMGPVNPLAVSEFEELNERHELLVEQLDDIKAARRDLQRVIRSINRQLETSFADAFADVAANFEVLFEALFPGGRGRLSLTDPEDLLNTGIEVEARPSGKRVKRLSLLSGGERTLAALAFLFAVFRSRPSPFYLLDEVEAALDDVNLQRFLVLVDQFREGSQLVIVTHQKRTMESADYLYGVSMRPGGSSVVVSERIDDAA